MRELQDRRKIRRLIYSKVTILLLFFILAFLSRSVWGMYQKNKVADYLKDKSELELTELKNQADELNANINRLKTKRGIEAEIRKNFSVTKEGEFVIMVVDPPENINLKTSTDQNQIGNFWSAIVGIFKDN